MRNQSGDGRGKSGQILAERWAKLRVADRRMVAGAITGHLRVTFKMQEGALQQGCRIFHRTAEHGGPLKVANGPELVAIRAELKAGIAKAEAILGEYLAAREFAEIPILFWYELGRLVKVEVGEVSE